MQLQRGQLLGVAVGVAGMIAGAAFVTAHMAGGRGLLAVSAIVLAAAFRNWRGPDA